MKTRSNENKKYLKDLNKIAKKVDKFLKAFLSSQKKNSYLMNPIRYGIFSGGKRFRAAIIFYTGKIFNINQKELIMISAAVECIHAYSLIHDDLPAMDNDELRRGKLTVHKKFDEATAVLAGDMFQVLSVKTLAESKHLSANQKINSIQMLSKANGLEGLIAGQSLDIYMKKNSNIKDIEKMYLLKTGALFSLCFHLLLNVKNLSLKKKKELKLIGEKIGKIFQVTDDMLDRWGDEKKVGKKINKDSQKANIAYKFSREECLKYLHQIQNKNYKVLQNFFNTSKEGLDYMSSLVDFIVNRVK